MATKKHTLSQFDSPLPSAAEMRFGIVVAEWNREVLFLFGKIAAFLNKRGNALGNLFPVQVNIRADVYKRQPIDGSRIFPVSNPIRPTAS